ncbi:TPA: type II toxin-antitoxin system RelE/ParE family toxin [Streptococcus suis]|uniref:type II toxin-antitoxin system RelE/ParE family toxin n=1 Tax=Streptococcus suis TaxID=1307 RepID=UPI000406A11E|nr:type II toxin-antitoxin system RelE/ParE family toxin [Streptococcus suis]HEM3165559.1 type II toxin-antitoxin system RelE/ParE family toxin [Streptococcus suis 92-1191]HEM6181754.1 type II toxin-antitoxin system RelE/ParE family toxin [Streptococcus suis]
MVYEVHLSAKAEQDLEEIYQYYVREFSESSARKVLASLSTAILTLEIFPEGYIDLDARLGRALFPEGKTRMIPGKQHLIFYLIRGSRVDILRIRGATPPSSTSLSKLV